MLSSVSSRARRRRLPNRRLSHTDTLQVDGQVFTATVGFDQHGIPAAALTKSIGRLPAGPVTPADLEGPRPGRVSASPIGAALDLVSSLKRERAK